LGIGEVEAEFLINERQRNAHIGAVKIIDRNADETHEENEVTEACGTKRRLF